MGDYFTLLHVHHFPLSPPHRISVKLVFPVHYHEVLSSNTTLLEPIGSKQKIIVLEFNFFITQWSSVCKFLDFC